MSIVLAIILIKTHALESLLTSFGLSPALVSFMGGIFFTSAFTSVPATVALVEVSRFTHPFFVALYGTCGALLGDLLIFRFIKMHISADLDYVLRALRWEERYLTLHHHFLKLKAWRWFFPLLGALIIASPLPDELGLMILGLAKVRTRSIILLTFTLNFFGILTIAYLARLFS